MRLLAVSLAVAATLALAGCDESRYRGAARHNIPIPPQLQSLMSEKGMRASDPVLIRTFKKEAELEVWKRDRTGEYALLKTYPICRWSGQLGPKKREGDRQAPEGFYNITPAQMNPNSSFYLSFNMGYPNAFDRAHGRTGSHLMVHGACSSAGCYSMSDDQIAEIYALVREAHNGGQTAVQMQSLPFRMTPANLARHRYNPNMPFWRNLKEGTDIFEVAGVEPRVTVCGARYTFNRDGDCREVPQDPALVAALTERRRKDEQQVAKLVAEGTPAVKMVYEDGGQHPKFTEVLMAAGSDALEQKTAWGSRAVGVSRPDAVLNGPREVAIDSRGRPQPETRTASAPAAAAPGAPALANVTPRPSVATEVARATPATGTAAPAAAQSSIARAATSAAGQTAAQATPQPAVTAPATDAQGGVLARVMSFNPFASAPAQGEAVEVKDNAVPQRTIAPLPPRRADAGRTPQAALTQ